MPIIAALREKKSGGGSENPNIPIALDLTTKIGTI